VLECKTEPRRPVGNIAPHCLDERTARPFAGHANAPDTDAGSTQI